MTVKPVFRLLLPERPQKKYAGDAGR